MKAEEKCCKECGILYDAEWFVKTSVVSVVSLVKQQRITPQRRNICPMCNQTAKDKKKHENRAIEKARRIIYSHGKKLAGTYGIKNGRDLIDRFGWSINRLQHDINHAYNNGCSYCGTLYKSMEHGLRDLTLDIVNREAAPYYGTNTHLCCATCNSMKGQRSPSAFGLHLAMVKRWKEAKPGSKYCPQYKLGLV